ASHEQMPSPLVHAVGNAAPDHHGDHSANIILRARRPRRFNRKADLVAASQHRGKVALESRYTVTNCSGSGMICDSSVRNWRDTVANLDLAQAAPTAAN